MRLEARLLARSEQGVCVCRIDFQGLPQATPSEAYHHIARAVAQVLPHAPQIPDRPDAPALSEFLEAALGADTIERLVLLLDELGVLPDTTRENLAHVLRALHTRRLMSPTLAKLQIILAGGIEIYNLAVVEALALRNVCEIVPLDNLSETDALNMVTDGLASIGIDPRRASSFARAIYQRVRGHPYLTQRLGQLLAAEHLIGTRIKPDLVDSCCWEMLDSGSDPLLEHLRQSIDEFGLEDAARRLLSGSQCTIRADAAIERLSLLGLAQRTGGFWTPRNPLFSVALAE